MPIAIWCWLDTLLQDRKLETNLLLAKWEAMRTAPPPRPPMPENPTLGDLLEWKYQERKKR